MRLSNYLFFTDQCEPALAFYATAGIGRIVRLMRHGEGGAPVRTETLRGRVLHAEFAGEGVHFFASDNDDAEPMRGSAMMFVLDDRARTERLFAMLADGAQITTPLGMQPWGDYYGKLTDRFGVQWMFNCEERRDA